MNGSQTGGFTPLRTIRTCTQHLVASPDRVFPLLCPQREYEWIEPWKCQIVYSDSGVAEQDCIFITDFPGEGADVWAVSVYRPNEEIQFVRFNGSRVIRYTITLAGSDDGTTTAEWKQVATGLNAEGNRSAEGLTDEAFRQKIQSLEQRLNHFLATGQMLKGIA
jgi:hypothetical protein